MLKSNKCLLQYTIVVQLYFPQFLSEKSHIILLSLFRFIQRTHHFEENRIIRSYCGAVVHKLVFHLFGKPQKSANYGVFSARD